MSCICKRVMYRAEHDTGVLLVKNTAWARQFFKEVVKVFRRPKVML